MKVAITQTWLFSLDFLFSFIAARFSLPGILILLGSAIPRTHVVLCTGCMLIFFSFLDIDTMEGLYNQKHSIPNDKTLNHLSERFDPSNIESQPGYQIIDI